MQIWKPELQEHHQQTRNQTEQPRPAPKQLVDFVGGCDQGKCKMSRDTKRLDSINSSEPKLATPHDLQNGGLRSGDTYIKKRSSKKEGRINLRAVAEVLTEEGLDPASELIRIIRSGTLDAKTQASVLNELLQYTQPKLKAVEVKNKVELNDDQVDARLKELMRKANEVIQ